MFLDIQPEFPLLQLEAVPTCLYAVWPAVNSRFSSPFTRVEFCKFFSPQKLTDIAFVSKLQKVSSSKLVQPPLHMNLFSTVGEVLHRASCYGLMY